jgi:outer membrane lipoprotein-sorting protein
MWESNKLNRILVLTFLSSALMGFALGSVSAESPTVDQVIEKNIAARGGLKPWREVQAMTMTGKMDAGTKDKVQLPFVMQLKRPRMLRLELGNGGTRALQVYDGANGWKVRPYLNRLEVEPYSDAEKQVAAEQQELDGFLIDHEAKGTKVELVGTEPVEGHDAYKLKLTLKDNDVRHVWVDAQSFLEVKVEGKPRKLDGKMCKVEIYYRNYTSVGGLKIPFVLETAVEKPTATREEIRRNRAAAAPMPNSKIIIEKVTLNPALEASAFAKPDISGFSLPPAPRPRAVEKRPASSPITTGAANEKTNEKNR